MKHHYLLDKKTKYNELFDFYGNLLTDKQQKILVFYLRDDFSLSEISEEFCISRQAVNEHLKRAEELMLNYEKLLGLQLKQSKRAEIYNFIKKEAHSKPLLQSQELINYIELLENIDYIE